ncbi:hypothetical protein FRC14_005253 [Serendipita sp. 396]|nr:hypothetical protein FRC14_005253 [Serendipita sp. 396]
MQANHRTSFPMAGNIVYTQVPSADDSTQRFSYYDPYGQQQEQQQQTPIAILSNPGLYHHNDPHSANAFLSNGYQYPPSMAQPPTAPLPPSQTRLANSNTGIIRVLGKTVIAIVLSIGLSLVFFLYIFFQRTAWSASILQTTVPLGNVLLLFSILSKIAMTSIPIVMSITAFHTADSWLRRQKSGQPGAVATPYQYNLVLDIFTGANIFAAWKALRYLVRPVAHSTSQPTAHSQAKARRTRRRATYVFETSIATLVILLVIAYAIAAVDFALHHLSSPALVQKQMHGDDPKAHSYGRQLKSDCLLRDPESGSPCTILYEFGQGFLRWRYDAAYITDYSEALKVAGHTSDVNKVVVVNDGDHQVAALVPAEHSVTPGSSYAAQTIGMYAECEPVTSSCAFTSACTACDVTPCLINEYPELGAFVGFTKPTGQIGSYIPDQNMWRLNESGSNGTDVNPYVFSFNGGMYTESTMQTAGMEPNGVWGHGAESPLSSVVLICKATIVDIEFRYTAVDDSYSIISSTPSTNNATIRSVTAILDVPQSPFEDFFSDLQPIALSSSTGEDFIRSFEMQYVKMYLPFAQAAFEPIPASHVEVVEVVQGSSIPTPWLLAYLALVVLFGLFAFLQGLLALGVDKTAVWRPNMNAGVTGKRGLFGKASSEGTWVNVVQLASERLTAPTALVFEAFERVEGDAHSQTRSLQQGGLEMFKEGTKKGTPSGKIGIGFVLGQRLGVEKGIGTFGLLSVVSS